MPNKTLNVTTTIDLESLAVLCPLIQDRIFDLQESFTLSSQIDDKRLINNEINYLQDLLNFIETSSDSFNRLQTHFDTQ